MDLKELGSRLRAERQRQGLTIEQVMEITKISRVNINALENGDHKEFPHAVYAKGFIKNYAKALGLNAEEIGDDFSRFLAACSDGEDIFQVEQPQQDTYVDTGKKGSLGIILIVVLLAGIVGGLVYYLHDSSLLDFGKKDSATATIVSESESGKAPVEPSGSEEKALEPAAVKEADQNEVPAPAEQEAASKAEVEPTPAAPEQEPAPVAEVTVPAATGNVVVVTAKPGQACWLEVVTDGTRSEYVLQEGDTLSLPYSENLKLKLGNGGGVDVLSDGKPFEFDASKGKVVNLEFPVRP
ncbi:RodZ domain-containing protein [Maridesulfovibrio sp. FT414]|uniref:RodZ domain-containing protein n=1 Tax=Maridesulfovibrio sp. FT414 TaxID=2979469 RepID=UPI003D8092BA